MTTSSSNPVWDWLKAIAVAIVAGTAFGFLLAYLAAFG